jgi:hypothetical protein
MTETWVYLIKNHSVLAICAGLLFLLGACSSTLSTVKTFEDPDYADASFSKILVIGVAGSYESRARWERTMASRISSRGASATAYHAVVGRNQEINRNSVTNAVRANQFVRRNGEARRFDRKGIPDGRPAYRSVSL